MIDRKVWFVTGASRGMGVDIVKAALSAGHAVVATGRSTKAVAKAVGEADQLLVAKLDVTRPDDAKAAVAAAVERFGGVDVLVNNAGNFYAGFFEELPADDFRAQVETNLFGPINVTRAVLPIMRSRRRGLIVTLSSLAGIAGQPFVSAYSASKFALEGWMEALAPEVSPFGIRTMLVEPGYFRTALLTEESTKYPQPSIDDYAEKTRTTVTAWKGMNGMQPGDPAKLAKGPARGQWRTAPALDRGRRCHRRGRTEGEAFARTSECSPGAVRVARTLGHEVDTQKRCHPSSRGQNVGKT